MLKLTLQPGEYLTIGDDIKVIFSGGSANNIHLLVDAPRNSPLTVAIPRQINPKIRLPIIKKREYPKKPKKKLLRFSSMRKNSMPSSRLFSISLYKRSHRN